MKKINIYFIILIFVFGYTQSSCSGFLDLSDPAALTSDNYWTNKAEAESALASCYNALYSQGLYYHYYNGCDPRALDGNGTDDGIAGSAWPSPPQSALSRGNLVPSHELVKVVWDACYKGIARCNDVILSVPKMGSGKIDPKDADRIIGEAKFLRAYFYNYLTFLYRDVPLTTEPVTTSNMPVTKKADVTKFIIDDLKAVAESEALPKKVTLAEKGRASRGAAWALLCRIYLYNQQWTEAADVTSKVMSQQDYGYSLEPDYLKLFSEDGNASNEVIFAVRFSGTAGGVNNELRGFLSTRYNQQYLTLYSVTQSLLNEYYDRDGNPSISTDPDVKDPRWRYNFIGIREEWRNGEQILSGYINKYQDYTVTQKWYDDQDYYVIRYADILLMRAEALANSGGSQTEIESLINQIRDRESVKMPHVTPAEVTAAGSLLNVVKHERRVELAFEGFRYFDLKRWGEYAKLSEFNRIGEEKSHVWPIPQDEIDNNKAIGQAPEWGGK